MRRKKKTYTKKELAYIDRLMSKRMDRVKAEWYLNAMQIWTDEDYKSYARFHLELMGEDPDEYEKLR